MSTEQNERNRQRYGKTIETEMVMNGQRYTPYHYKWYIERGEIVALEQADGYSTFYVPITGNVIRMYDEAFLSVTDSKQRALYDASGIATQEQDRLRKELQRRDIGLDERERAVSVYADREANGHRRAAALLLGKIDGPVCKDILGLQLPKANEN